MTVDLEVMTLTGVQIYKKDKNNFDKLFFPWSIENMPPLEFLEGERDPKTGDIRI